MLNRVDLPQPDGPITARNSPGATVNEMRSTATSGPSGVSKRFDTSSTTRIGSAVCAAGASARAGVAAVTMRRSVGHEHCARAPSPPLGGEGWGEGVYPRVEASRFVESPPHPDLLPLK